MKIGIRADASVQQGAGHVMRCLALAEALLHRGHSVELIGSVTGIPWLTRAVVDSHVTLVEHPAGDLDESRILGRGLTGLIVDSYLIPARAISQLNEKLNCLAIVDSDTRGIRASLYLDQNLGAELRDQTIDPSRWLGGSHYALIRDEILTHRVASPPPTGDHPLHVVAFMGGTDPGGMSVDIARGLVARALDIELTMVVPTRWVTSTNSALTAQPASRVVETTAELPSILGSADVVVSAAGTSAWDICAMGRPAVLVATIENQVPALRHVADAGIALTVNAIESGPAAPQRVASHVAALVDSSLLRSELAMSGLRTFDGLGKFRVVEALEREWTIA